MHQVIQIDFNRQSFTIKLINHVEDALCSSCPTTSKNRMTLQPISDHESGDVEWQQAPLTTCQKINNPLNYNKTFDLKDLVRYPDFFLPEGLRIRSKF